MDFGLIISAAVETGEAVAQNNRMFGIDSQLFWQVVAQIFNVTLLFGLLTWLLYKPVRKALQARTDRIQEQLSQAEDELIKATSLRETYEQKMDEAAKERDEILAEARRQAQETSIKLINEAKKEAEAVREKAAANVKMEWERAENDMREAIIDVSAVMAEKFVSLAINKETHDKLFKETISDLEGMTWRD